MGPRRAWVGVAHALSPDVHVGPPGRRSLRWKLRFAILAALASAARSRARATPPERASRKDSTAQQRTPRAHEAVAALTPATFVF